MEVSWLWGRPFERFSGYAQSAILPMFMLHLVDICNQELKCHYNIIHFMVWQCFSIAPYQLVRVPELTITKVACNNEN